MLVAVAVDGEEADARAALTGRGAAIVDERTSTSGRKVIHAGPLGDEEAAAVVTDLRADGWAATTRPETGGQLTAWRNNNRPIYAGDRVCVCLPWAEEPAAFGPVVVDIDPGRAFGAGAHPSTRLLLTVLGERIRGGERALDVGCGTGALAVAAAALGATSVVAVDIEAEARVMTARNAQRNGVAGHVMVAPGELSDAGGGFDVIVANITADPLIELAPEIVARLTPAGWVGLSGVSPGQLSMVLAAYQPLVVVETRRDDDWAALVLAPG